MRKPMIKIYIVLVVSLILCVLLVPSGIGYTSAWAMDAAVRIRLMSHPHAQAATDTSDQARIVFVMDDGWETQYSQGYPILARYDYPGCIAVIPAAVGTAGYMTYGELADLYIAGWDMLNHTYNHTLLAGLPQESQREQMNQAREWLESRGLRRGSDTLVFPGGDFDSVTLSELLSSGYSAGRSLKSLWTAKSGCGLEDVEVCNLVSGLSFEYVQAAIDKAVRNSSALILVIHKIEPISDDTFMQVPPEGFTRIVDYIRQCGDGLRVVTVTQLLSSP
jgi:peptidoglycan/xylan/chitin deacetylase (PgdA/CDA1 family)